MSVAAATKEITLVAVGGRSAAQGEDTHSDTDASRNKQMHSWRPENESEAKTDPHHESAARRRIYLSGTGHVLVVVFVG